jgi:hypothetical protein
VDTSALEISAAFFFRLLLEIGNRIFLRNFVTSLDKYSTVSRSRGQQYGAYGIRGFEKRSIF